MNKFENQQAENPEKINIPEKEYSISFARSGGHGGQNVNKLNTKAILKFNVNDSATLSDEQKEKVKQFWKNRINEAGELTLFAERERLQLRNKEEVVEKLQRFINEALVEKKKRIETKPSKSSNEKRLKEKIKTGRKKELRKKPNKYDY